MGVLPALTLPAFRGNLSSLPLPLFLSEDKILGYVGVFWYSQPSQAEASEATLGYLHPISWCSDEDS